MTKKEKNRYLLIVLSVAFASFMVRLNNYTVNVSLPAIAEHFNVGTGQVSRIIMSYLLIITSTLLLFGKLGDRIGLKNVFIYGYAIFVGGSLLCGLSNGIHTLIGARMIQGLGGSMLLATSFAIISKFLPREKTGWAFGITSTASALGVATGAPLGGLITGYLSWHWIFFINVPVGIIAIWVAGKKIPKEEKSPVPMEGAGALAPEKERFDLWGAVLSFGGLSILLYGFNMGKEWGWGSPAIMLCFVSAAVLLVLFILREKTFSAPLLDLTLFKNVTFRLALCATFMAYLLISGNAFIMPFYLKTTQGLNSQQIGLVLLVYSLIYVFMSSYAGRLADKVSPIKLCTVAMLSATVNTFLFAYTLRFTGLGFSLMYLIWMAFSFVFFFSPNNKQVMGCAPQDRHGVASGVFNTTTNLSMVFGVALFEAVFSQFSGGVALKAGSPAQQTPLLKGFNAAYVLGGLVCAGALVFSLLIKNTKNSEASSQ
ncbi:MAG: DHA2 family efflux MFS transporter permease subunit [Desulfobacteraceae bacterium]|nr:MAG: DHA2 family efflux MFS transporter permease subunit [Desulfobacteraceae bacterium]